MTVALRYGLGEIGRELLEKLLQEVDFNALPAAEAGSRGERARRYSTFRCQAGAVAVLPNTPFSQPDSFGRVRSEPRAFAPLVEPQEAPDTWRGIRELNEEVRHLTRTENVEVGVHAIRTVSRKPAAGVPAPEGLHRDGFRYVGLLVCSAPRSGAETCLVCVEDARYVDLGALQAGELLVFDDRAYLHYTARFLAAQDCARRDVIVVTVQ
jgi:hypothetical protein